MNIFTPEVVRRKPIDDDKEILDSMRFRHDTTTAVAKKAWREVERFRREGDQICRLRKRHGLMLRRDQMRLYAASFLKSDMVSIAQKAEVRAKRLQKEIDLFERELAKKARTEIKKGD